MKASYQKFFYPLILLLLVGVVTPAFAYPDWHENSNGPNYGSFSWAYAYVGGWWWGTSYCGLSGGGCTHSWNYWIDPNYPYGKDPKMTNFSSCGYNYAWTKTVVKLQDSFGYWFIDSQALASI
jgi:hypothetical protein